MNERTSHIILSKSDFARALQYARNHFVELQRYLDDLRLPMDNNDTSSASQNLFQYVVNTEWGSGEVSPHSFDQTTSPYSIHLRRRIPL